jgi:FOG: CheY-like receiver
LTSVASSLAGLRVLVVEDEALLAVDLEMLLEEAGCEVLGPARSARRAFSLLEEAGPVDFALLDLTLGEERNDRLPDTLAAQGTPFAFLTGHVRACLPPRHRDAPLIQKPFREARLLAQIAELADPA